MRLSQFSKLLKDCDLLVKDHEAETKLVFVEAATLAMQAAPSPEPGQKHGDNKQLSFEAFCYALSRVIAKLEIILAPYSIHL